MNSIDFTKLKPGNYNRKSSEGEDRQVLSIPTQVEEAQKLSEFYNLPDFISVFQESKSAKTEYLRPEFAKMMAMIERGEIDSIVCWKLDRLARNMTEGGKIIDFLSSGRIKAIFTHDKVFYPWDNVIVMSVEFSQGKQYVKDLSVNVKRGQTKKARMGYPHAVAAIGFLNDNTEEKGNKKWKIDENRFSLIKELFDLFLSGNWTVSKLSRFARDELKLTTPKHKKNGGCLISRSRMYAILKDPIYAGFFYQGNIRYELNQELPRIISESEYISIQRMISNRNVPKVQRHETTYTGYIQSPEGHYIGQDVKYQLICDCKFKFSYKSKESCPRCDKTIQKLQNPTFLQYRYYYNVKRRKMGLPTHAISEKQIDQYLSNYLLKNFTISPALAKWCQRQLNEVQESAVIRKIELQKNAELITEKLTAKKKRFRQLLADEYISPEEYKTEILDIELELQKINKPGLNTNWVNNAEKLINLAQSIKNIFSDKNPQKKRAFLSDLGSNLTWNEEKLDIINSKSVQALINGLNAARMKNRLFEPENIIDTSIRNVVFQDVCPIMRQTWDNVHKALIDNNLDDP